MKVGVISTVFPSSRMPTAGIFVREELDALSSHVSVRIMAPQPNRQWLKNIGASTPRVSYPIKRPFTLAFPRFFRQDLYPASLAMLLRWHSAFFDDCDLIHAHNAFPEGVAAVKAFGGKKPVIITTHGSDINYFAQRENLQPDIVEALNEADCIIAVSSQLKKSIEKLGVRTDIHVIHNGFFTDLLKPKPKKEACTVLDLDPDRPRLLFAGNFVPVKGIEYLIRAIPSVLKKYPECELVLLGAQSDSGDSKHYIAEIDRAGIKDSLRIEARVPHERLADWINASDLLVLPSHNEGFGLVLAEALACGKPVVSTLSGGPEDIVMPGDGYLVPPADVEALANALIRVLDGDAISDTDTLVSSAVDRFSYETIARRIADVYEKVFAGKSGG